MRLVVTGKARADLLRIYLYLDERSQVLLILSRAASMRILKTWSGFLSSGGSDHGFLPVFGALWSACILSSTGVIRSRFRWFA
jgi:hypothetical protein